MRRYSLILIVSLILLMGCEENSIVEDIISETEVKAEKDLETKVITKVEDSTIVVANEPKVEEALPIVEDQEQQDEEKNKLITTITNKIIKEEIENSQFNEDEIEFLEKIMGRWTFQDEEDLFLDLQNHVELIGVSQGQLMTRGEFSVSDINIKDQFIILHIFSEVIDYGPEQQNPEQQELYSKLYLKNNGEELLYVNDYLDKQIESTWIK